MSYSGNTLAFQAKARGSIPLIRFKTQSIDFSNLAFEKFWFILYNDQNLLKIIWLKTYFRQAS